MNLEKSYSNDCEEQVVSLKDTRNRFVFHNNREFINFQQKFSKPVMSTDAPIALDANCGASGDDFMFYPSNECDHIHLTFMYSNAPYEIINNKAFFWEGFKEIVIQGARSEHCLSQDIPTLVVYNECASGASLYEDCNGNICHSYCSDDAIFNIQNEHSSPVNVVVSDIAFRVAFDLADVESASLYRWWYHPDICPVMFKVYEANSFKMFNVRMYSQFLDLTHVFLHWCENVDITNCVFENYNARKIGGNLWICQRARNINIVNNDFYKYGNDENIGIWGDSIMSRDEERCYTSMETLKGLDGVQYANRHLDFEHIHIKGNRFYYKKPDYLFGKANDRTTDSKNEVFPYYVDLTHIHDFQQSEEGFKQEDGEDEWDGVIDLFQSFYIAQHTLIDRIKFDVSSGNTGSASCETVMTKANDFGEGVSKAIQSAIVPYVHYRISDYVVESNEFYIDSPMNVLMGMTFDNFCQTEDLRVTNNVIKYGSWAHSNCQLQDFKIVYDKNTDREKTCEGLQGTNKISLCPILIEDNTIESEAFPYMVYDNTTEADEVHIVLNTENASVAFNRNTITELREKVKQMNSTINAGNNGFGYTLLYSRDKGGRITMNDNVCRGMKLMGSLLFGKGNAFSRMGLSASNNIFQGVTTLFSENMKEGVFKFVNNTFLSESGVLLLQEMPNKTLLSLTDNTFKRVGISSEGVLYYHYISPKESDRVNDQPLPSDMVIMSSGNLFDNISGNICPYYLTEKDFEIFSSGEPSLEDAYYKDKGRK